MGFRIGQGIDFHRLDNGLKLFLGGIQIPSEKGCIAHSDGDVLIHSMCDALLGAAGLEDIGHQFPDTDSRFRGIDSKILLEKTCVLLEENGYMVVNIDSTVCLEKPKIAQYIREMKNILAPILKISPGDVGIKATTTEKMGFTGREEGVVAISVALITAKG